MSYFERISYYDLLNQKKKILRKNKNRRTEVALHLKPSACIAQKTTREQTFGQGKLRSSKWNEMGIWVLVIKAINLAVSTLKKLEHKKIKASLYYPSPYWDKQKEGGL